MLVQSLTPVMGKWAGAALPGVRAGLGDSVGDKGLGELLEVTCEHRFRTMEWYPLGGLFSRDPGQPPQLMCNPGVIGNH